MDNLFFVNRPTQETMNNIFSWCQTWVNERFNSGDDIPNVGVYAISKGNDTVAYLFFCELTETSVEIYFIEVKDDYKNKGVGSLLVLKSFDSFVEKGYKVVNIHCVTEAGKNHAEKNGFVEYYPANIGKSSKSVSWWMFYSLLPSQRFEPYKEDDHLKFVVWCDSYSGNDKPDLQFDLESDSMLPIVDYLNHDYCVAIMEKGLIRNGNDNIKAKRFFKDKNGKTSLEHAVFISRNDILEGMRKYYA